MKTLHKPLKLASARHAKPIIAEFRDDVLRPRAGKYFRPSMAKLRDSALLRGPRSAHKQHIRRADRRAAKIALDN